MIRPNMIGWMEKLTGVRRINVSLAGVRKTVGEKSGHSGYYRSSPGFCRKKIGIRIRQLMENGRRLPCFLME